MHDWRVAVREQLLSRRLDPELEWEIVEELAQHLQDRYDEMVASGEDGDAARRQLLDEVADGALVSSRLRTRHEPPKAPAAGIAMNSSPLVAFGADLRHGLRRLRSEPVFTMVCVAILALGIGASTVMYVYIGTIFRAASPPVDLERQVALWSFNPSQGDPKILASPLDYHQWKQRSTSFDLLAASETRAFNLSGTSEPERVSGVSITSDYFQLVGARIILGRPFTETDMEPGNEKVAILDERLWRNHFQGSLDIVGRTIHLDGVRTTVIGVVIVGVGSGRLFVPLDARSRMDDAARTLFVMARLRPGVTMEQARAEMLAIGTQIQQEYPDSHQGWSINTRPLSEEYIGPQARIVFTILGGAVGALLLIGCANVANLLFARNLARRGEIALRTALGASGSRIARQLLTESLLLGLLAGLAGLGLCQIGLVWVRAALPVAAIDPADLTISARVIGATFGLSLASVLMFGLLPLWQLRRLDPSESLQDGTRRSTSGRRTQRMRALLVSIEVTLAVVLMVVAGLLIRVLIQFETIADSGFDADNVLTATVTLPETQYSLQAAVDFFERAVARSAEQPGIVVASAVSRVPAAGSRWNPNRSLVVEGREPRQEDPTWALDVAVMPGYFEALKIPLLEGRDVASGDRSGSLLVAVVNRTMAKRYWPTRSPLGARIRLGDEPAGEWRTIVGVVGDVRNDDIDSPTLPHVFVPLPQRPRREMTFVLRTGAVPESHIPALRSAVEFVDKDQPFYDVRTMRQLLDSDLADSRVLIQVLGSFALFALILASAGIYSVVTYSVNQRLPEIGVRLALGATGVAVLRMLLFQLLKPVFMGLLAGFAIAFGIATAIRSILFQTPPNDPATFLGVSLVFAATAAIAIAGPARRALRADPLRAMRAR